jgi:dipeptidyl aminopeptidase/acylaminoacyl peptidase
MKPAIAIHRVLLAAACGLWVSGGLAAAPEHDGGSEMLGRWQRAFERTRGKVSDERIHHAWSPDGSEIVFERSVEGKRSLWRCRLPDGEPKSVLEGAEIDKGWKTFRFGGDGGLRLQRGNQWWQVGDPDDPLEKCDPPAGPDDSGEKGRREKKPRGQSGSWRSPDGRWQAAVRDGALWLERPGKKEEPRRLIEAGQGREWRGPPVWAPDSRHFAIWKEREVEERIVRLVEAAPKDQLQPKFRDIPYPKPGDEIDTRAPWVFSVDGGEPLGPDMSLIENPYSCRRLGWREDSRRLTFEFIERGFGCHRVIEIDAVARSQRVLVDESSETFVFTGGKSFRHDLDDGREILWASERDGWNHLYLLDGGSGKVKRQLTKGKCVLRKVLKVDEERRQVLVELSGCWPGQDPYFIHYARVGIDDGKVIPLTRSDGNHDRIEFSPDRKYYVCRWSRVNRPPVHELRRSSDGKLLRVLAEADASRLLATGWRPPEPFVAKGRDGKFDIWGVIVRPPDFDPAKKYPVIESIYAGPHDSFVPKSWGVWHRNMRELACEGFIMVKIDGRGTSNRSREFHHFCYKNVKDAGLPDRIAWMKAAAKEVEPAMDLERVGIFGGSAGGQSAMGAVLFHGDFYKAAAADCGCHDNRMDKLWWNEQWMDWPVGPHYAENSNVTHAAKLQAKALTDAGKDFELMVFADKGHGCGESGYGRTLRARFFKEHLGGAR